MSLTRGDLLGFRYGPAQFQAGSMSSKHATALWEEVQGSCDLSRLDQALSVLVSGSSTPFETLVLDGWTPLQYVCANQSVGNAVRAEAISRLLRIRVPVNAVDEVRRLLPLI